MRNISKSIYAAIMGLSVLGAGAANASGTFDVAPGDGTYTFDSTSNVVLTNNGSTVNCQLHLVGDVSGDGTSTVSIEVTSGSVSGALFSGCNLVDLDFPWTATVAHDSSYPTSATSTATVPVTFNGVSVDTPVGQCSGATTVSFANAVSGSDTRSYFDFDNASIGSSGCTVDGTVYADPTDVNVTH